MKKYIIFSLSALSLCLLQACGGDDNGDSGADASTLKTPAAGATAPANNVSAKFVPNESTRAILLSPNGPSILASEVVEQLDSGALVRLGPASLSGARQIADIAGDTHFALGRWLKGTVSDDEYTDELKGDDSGSYHYLADNRLSKLPTSGQLQCTTVATTAPTALSDTRAKVGSATGSATVSFDVNGAAIQGSIQVRAGKETADVTLSTHIKDAAQMSVTGKMLGSGSGAMVALAEQADGAPGLVMAYKAQLPNGIFYQGVTRFACKSK